MGGAVFVINLETYLRPSGDLHSTDSSVIGVGVPLVGGSESLSGRVAKLRNRYT
jgi:hypothetical protein